MGRNLPVNHNPPWDVVPPTIEELWVPRCPQKGAHSQVAHGDSDRYGRAGACSSQHLGFPGKPNHPMEALARALPILVPPRIVPVPKSPGGTSPLHGLDALQDEAGHRPSLPLAQRLQGAAENRIWKKQRGLEHSQVTPEGCPVTSPGWGPGLGTSQRVLFPCGCHTGVAGGDGTCPSPSPRHRVRVGLGPLSQLHPWLSPPPSQPGDTPRGLSPILAPTLDVAPLAQGLQRWPPLQELAEFVPDFAGVTLTAGAAQHLPSHWRGHGTHQHCPGMSHHHGTPAGWPPHPAWWMVMPVPVPVLGCLSSPALFSSLLPSFSREPNSAPLSASSSPGTSVP